MERTHDPDVVVEHREPPDGHGHHGMVRYRRLSDGRRWEVHGHCDYRGNCLIGADIDGEIVRDHAHLEEIRRRKDVDRLISEMDVPVTPEFGGCCPFRFVELERAR